MTSKSARLAARSFSGLVVCCLVACRPAVVEHGGSIEVRVPAASLGGGGGREENERGPARPLAGPPKSLPRRFTVAPVLIPLDGVKWYSFDHPMISGDGRWVAFEGICAVPKGRLCLESYGTFEMPRNSDIFLRDLPAQTIFRVTKSRKGKAPNGYSSMGDISHDGRFVALDTKATNLMPGRSGYGVLVFDRHTGKFTPVERDSKGRLSEYVGLFPKISGDGTRVIFESDGPDLVPDDRNQARDVFMRDLVHQWTQRVSIASDGSEANGSSSNEDLSSDGRYVLFSSTATNLTQGDASTTCLYFVRDLEAGETRRVKGVSANGQYVEFCNGAKISGDGAWVVFEGRLREDQNVGSTRRASIYAWSVRDGTLEQVSVAWDGSKPNGHCANPRVSGDGRYVTFESVASNLVPDDRNGLRDVFVTDRHTHHTIRVSIAPDGSDGNRNSYYPDLSDNGRLVVFSSSATNLLPDQSQAEDGLFVADLEHAWDQEAAAPVSESSAKPQTHPVPPAQSLTQSGAPPLSKGRRFTMARVVVSPSSDELYQVGTPLISGDGRWVIFTGPCNGLVDSPCPESHEFHKWPRVYDIYQHENVWPKLEDIYMRDLYTQTMIRVTQARINSRSVKDMIDISADGQFIALDSEGTDQLVSPNERGGLLFDRHTKKFTSLFLDSRDENTKFWELFPRISKDGSRVVFTSNNKNLVPNDLNEKRDVFVRDLLQKWIRRVSVTADGDEVYSDSESGDISADGRHVLFSSFAENLTRLDKSKECRYFVHDLETGENRRVNGVSPNGQYVDSCDNPKISGDGAWVVFEGRLLNDPKRIRNQNLVYTWGAKDGALERVSVAWDGGEPNSACQQPRISADGRYVVFESEASNLVPDDRNGVSDVFVTDRRTHQTIRVSVTPDGADGNGDSYGADISDDGRFVVFESRAKNLLSDRSQAEVEVFVADLKNAWDQVPDVAVSLSP